MMSVGFDDEIPGRDRYQTILPEVRCTWGQEKMQLLALNCVQYNRSFIRPNNNAEFIV